MAIRWLVLTTLTPKILWQSLARMTRPSIEARLVSGKMVYGLSGITDIAAPLSH